MPNLESSLRISSCESIPSSPRSSFCSNSFSTCQLSRFYSEPTSPTRSCTSDSPFLWELEKEKFMIKSSSPVGEIDNNFEESFEFKTIATIFDNFETPLSCHQNHQKPEPDQICFADQLFDNGHILPLKPPPRVQYCSSVNNAKFMSEKSVLKSSLACWSLNKADFDPFAAALEHVKKEERWNQKIPTNKSRCRSRSLSPMKTTTCPPSLCANIPNEHPATWNGKMPPHRRLGNANPTKLTYFEPRALVTTKPVEKTKEAATLAVFPGRSVKLVKAQKSKRVNLLREFLVLKMGCLGVKG